MIKLGLTFGRWIVSKIENDGIVIFCKCIKCDKENKFDYVEVLEKHDKKCFSCIGRSRSNIKKEIKIIKDGDKFNKWTVIKEIEVDESQRRQYLVKCDCGKEGKVPGVDLKTNRSTQCSNCGRKEIIELGKQKRLNNLKMMVGQSLNSFIILEIEIKEGRDAADTPVKVICNVCNTETILNYNKLRSPCKTCKDKEKSYANLPERDILRGMIDRCYNAKNKAFKYYGGRGIKVCDEWLGENGFDKFYAHIGPRPIVEGIKYTIDRINNDGHYEPGNVRWATYEQQANNTRANRKITLNGETKNFGQWAKDLENISPSTVRYRLESGKTVEEAFKDTPLIREVPKSTLYDYKSEKLSLVDWSQKLEVTTNTLKTQLNRLGSFEKVVEHYEEINKKPKYELSTYVGEMLIVKIIRKKNLKYYYKLKCSKQKHNYFAEESKIIDKCNKCIIEENNKLDKYYVEIGQKFGKLTVEILLVKKDKPGNSYYRCKCKCGNIVDVRVGNLINMKIKSCSNCENFNNAE